MNGLQPFFCYYGGKWRAALKYPRPEQDLIVEPFAGAAGYATRYSDHRVLLIEKDPVIASLWKYLIKVRASEVLAIPLLGNDQTIDDLGGVPPEAKALVGFWLNKGAAAPRRSPSKWMRDGLRPKSYWGPEIRARIAAQVERIRHWECREGSYDCAPVVVATWFVDPPYQKAGKHYRCSSAELEFPLLAEWVKGRRGTTIVCENSGATWLPFERHADIKASSSKHGGKSSAEVIYVQRSEALAAE